MEVLLPRALLCPLLVVILLITPFASAVDPLDFLESLKDDEDTQPRYESTSTEYPNGVNVIPGDPDINYPVLSTIPKSSFSCIGRPVGFYADTELRCQVWHICDEDRRQQSFLCTNGTVYSQEKRVCDWWYNVPCDPSEVTRNYLQNYDLYKDAPKSDNVKEKNDKDKKNNEDNKHNNNSNDFDYEPTTKSYKDPFAQFPSSRQNTESQQKPRINNQNDDQRNTKPTPSYNEPFSSRGDTTYSNNNNNNNNNYNNNNNNKNNNDFSSPRRQQSSQPPQRPTTTSTTYRPPTTTYNTPPPPAALQGNSFSPKATQQHQRPQQVQQQPKPQQKSQQQQPDSTRSQPSIKTTNSGGKRIVEIRVPLSQIPPEILAKYGKRIPELILKEIFLNFTRNQQQELQKEAISSVKPSNPTGPSSRSPPPSAPVPQNRQSNSPPPPSKKPVDFNRNGNGNDNNRNGNDNNRNGNDNNRNGNDNNRNSGNVNNRNSGNDNNRNSGNDNNRNSGNDNNRNSGNDNNRNGNDNNRNGNDNSRNGNDNNRNGNDNNRNGNDNNRNGNDNIRNGNDNNRNGNDNNRTGNEKNRNGNENNDKSSSFSGNSKPSNNPPPPPAEFQHKFRHSTPRRVDNVKFATPTRELLAEYEDERQQVGESQNPIYSLQQLFSAPHSRTSGKSRAPAANEVGRVKESFNYETTTTSTYQPPQQYQDFTRPHRRRTHTPPTTAAPTFTTTQEPELITDRYFPVSTKEEKKNAEIRRIFLVAKQGIKVLPPIPVLSGAAAVEVPTARRAPPPLPVTHRPQFRTTPVHEFSKIPPPPKVAIPEDYYVKNERFEEAESRYPQPSAPPRYTEPQFQQRQYSRPTTPSIPPTTTTTTAPPPPTTPHFPDQEFRRNKPNKPHQNKKKVTSSPPVEKQQEDTPDYDSPQDHVNQDELELLRLAQEYIDLTGQDFGVRKTPRNA